MTPSITQRRRIMVVDDIEDNYVLLCRALTRAGFDTISHDNGVDAIATISVDPPDLLMLDWMMPNLSGLDVVHAVRERFSANELPIIMCTARDESISINQAIEAGANDYVQKPIDMAIAIARINAQLERRATQQALSEMNRDLEATLAQRTRALMERRRGPATPPTSDAAREAEEILRLAAWLRTPEASSDPVLLNACADSLVSVACRLSVV